MKLLAGYIGIFSTSALIGLIGVADKVHILKAHREDRKEFLVEIKELRKGITELSTQLKEHRNNHED
jgi:hypothetical protein